MTQDQSTNTEDEFYEEASEEFPSIADLIVGAHSGIKSEVVGRLVAVWPRENGKREGNNGVYDWCDTVTLVLDDGPDGTMVTDLVSEAPQEVAIRYSTGGTFSRIGPRLDGMTKPKRDQDGNVIVPSRPQKYLPLIGRLQAKPAKQKGNNPPIRFTQITGSDTEAADKAIAKKFEAEIREITAKLKAKDAEVADAEAFE